MRLSFVSVVRNLNASRFKAIRKKSGIVSVGEAEESTG